MKKSIFASIFLAFIAFQGSAQTISYVTIYSTYGAHDYPVKTNQIISVVGYDWVSRPSLSGNLSDGTSLDLSPFCNYQFLLQSSQNSHYFGASQIPQIITDVTNIEVQKSVIEDDDTVSFNPPGWATFKITTPACANVVSNYVPADAVVIPASAQGTAQIILESSPDLVNWVAAMPGTYGVASATNRFFRVRIIAN